MPDRIVVHSPAKINLTLDIKGKRPDGYHELETVMHQVDLCDLVTVSRAEHNISLSANSREIPMDSSNLAYRAAIAFMDRYDIRSGCDIAIKKTIPVGAGLAGGSGNAAAVLEAMNQIFGVGASLAELCQLGGELGSDIPFCLWGGTALGTGRGEVLQALPPGPEMNILLVNPGFALSTADVYGRFRLEADMRHPDLHDFLLAWHRCDIISVAENMENVLESVSIAEHPGIGSIKNEMIRLGASGALMSGSGPTVFAVFIDPEGALQAYRHLSTRYSACFLTRSYRKHL